MLRIYKHLPKTEGLKRYQGLSDLNRQSLYNLWSQVELHPLILKKHPGTEEVNRCAALKVRSKSREKITGVIRSYFLAPAFYTSWSQWRLLLLIPEKKLNYNKGVRKQKHRCKSGEDMNDQKEATPDNILYLGSQN